MAVYVKALWTLCSFQVFYNTKQAHSFCFKAASPLLCKFILSFCFRDHCLFLTCVRLCAVVDLVYWRSVRRTGVVFTGLVIGLASVFQLSVITVLSHVCLGVMCVTFPLRLYYKLLELLRWNPGVHPFQWVLRVSSDIFGLFLHHQALTELSCNTMGWNSDVG